MFLVYPVGILGMGSGDYGLRRRYGGLFHQPFDVLDRGSQQELVAGPCYTNLR